MRHHRQIGQPGELRHQILLAPADHGEAGRRRLAMHRPRRHRHPMRRGEAVEQGVDRIGPAGRLALGRGNHVLDHRARQPLPGQRRHVAAVDPDMQCRQMAAENLGHHPGGRQRRLPRVGSGQWHQQLANGHGTSGLGMMTAA
jgi:hypothetical protein